MINIRTLLDATRSHAMRIGHAERVVRHEPLHSPGHGLTVGVWPGRIRPARTSGLAAISVQVVLRVRLYGALEKEPSDELADEMIDATDALLQAYAGDLDLGVPQVRHVDVFGAEGVPLSAQPGYLDMADGTCRIVDIDLPLIVNDVWNEAV